MEELVAGGGRRLAVEQDAGGATRPEQGAPVACGAVMVMVLVVVCEVMVAVVVVVVCDGGGCV